MPFFALPFIFIQTFGYQSVRVVECVALWKPFIANWCPPQCLGAEQQCGLRRQAGSRSSTCEAAGSNCDRAKGRSIHESEHERAAPYGVCSVSGLQNGLHSFWLCNKQPPSIGLMGRFLTVLFFTWRLHCSSSHFFLLFLLLFIWCYILTIF
jgi:hypothetical protein